MRLGLLGAPAGQATHAASPSSPGGCQGAGGLYKELRPLVQAVATAFPQADVERGAVAEHGSGLKPLLHTVWGFDGQRPLAPVQQRFAWRSLVGCVRPSSGRTLFHLAASVASPLCETELAAFAQEVGASPGKPIVLVLDGAGWHTSLRLRVPEPEHVQLLVLPAYSPALQPAEHLWPLTNTALGNAHFANSKDLEDAQAARCVALQARPDLVRSATLFHWWPKRIRKRQGPRRN